MVSPSKLRRYLWHLVLYPNLAWKVRPDVEFYAQGYFRFRRKTATPSVLTCHNLLPFDRREMQRHEAGSEQPRLERFRLDQARAFQRASGVIFPSAHTAQTVLAQVHGIRDHRVIAHGLDRSYMLSQPRGYRLSPPIRTLYVSTILAYKHQVEVVRAIAEVRKATGLELTCRFVGASAPVARRAVEEAIGREGAEQYVRLVGELDDAELIRAYRSADLYIYASSCESFGISLLEAMGARLPIVCSDRSGLPDLVKDAAIYFDPENSSSLVDAVRMALEDEARRRSLAERAYEYASSYTWSRCAEQTFQFLEHVAGQSS